MLTAAVGQREMGGTRRRVGSAPPPRHSQGTPDDPQRSYSIGDTVSDVSPADTSKSPRRGSDAGSRGRSLPVARSLDEGPNVSLDFTESGDSSRSRSSKSSNIHGKSGKLVPTDSGVAQRDSATRARRRNRNQVELPSWAPWAILAGLVLSVILLVILAIKL
jgi:hypothetical protein